MAGNNSAFSQVGATPKQKLSNTIKTVGGFLSNPILQTSKMIAGAVKPQATQPTPAPVAPTPAPVTSGLLQPKAAPMAQPQVKPSTPVKKITTSDGTTTEYHAEPTPKATPTKPQVGSATNNAQNVLDAGGPTQAEQIASSRLYQAGQATPMEQYYSGRVQQAQGMRNAGMLGPYAEAGQYAEQTPQGLYDALINAPDLAGRAGASKGLYDQFSNIYGSQATQGLLAANTIAGRGLSAAQSGLSGAQTQAGRAQDSSQSVLTAGLPTYPSYGSQIINPLTGMPVNGGASGSLQDAVASVAQRITSGQMTYGDGVAALQGYGQGGLNALQQALPPGFNIAQSNTLAGQQGSIKVNYQLADTALKNAEQIMQGLGLFSNIPVLNKLRTFASVQSGIGAEQTRAYIGAIQSLRNAYASLLASSKGGTPTDYSNQAMAEIPEVPTAKDLEAIRHNFEVLGQARTDILGNPGQASGGSSGSGLFDW